MAKHPDEQIAASYYETMQDLAHFLDELFNGQKKGLDRKVCFVLLVSEFGNNASGVDRVNYISNGNRPDVVNMLKEITKRFEGQAEPKVGHA